MAGLMDKFFGSGAKHNGQQVPMPTPGNIPQGAGVTQQGTAAVASNGVTPSFPTDQQSQQANQDQQSKSPFAEFEKLWEPVTGPDGKPVQVTTDPLYTVDQNKVLEAARKTDFKSAVTQEQMAKINAGGPEAMQVMLDVMQTMAQLAYANSAVASTRIAEQGITKAMSQAESRLPGVIRQQAFGEGLAQKNPALQNPAVAPLVEMTRKQFAQKYPNATVAELETLTLDYMSKVSEAFNPAKQAAQAAEALAAQKANDNWDVFFGEQPGASPFNM